MVVAMRKIAKKVEHSLLVIFIVANTDYRTHLVTIHVLPQNQVERIRLNLFSRRITRKQKSINRHTRFTERITLKTVTGFIGSMRLPSGRG